MVSNKKFDRHRFKHAQMIDTPASDADENDPFHEFFTAM